MAQSLPICRCDDRQPLLRAADPPPAGHLSGKRVTCGNLQCTCDRCGIDGVLIAGHFTDPHLQGERGHRPRCAGHYLCVRGVELPGLTHELERGRARMLGRSNKEWNHITTSHILEKRHDFMTDSISLERWIFIAWILEWLPIEAATHLDRVRSSQRENGATRARGHRSQASESGATEQVDHHCLRLIIGCVTRRRIRSEHLVSSSSHARFEIRPALYLYRRRLKGSPDLCTRIRNQCCFF